MIQRVFSSAVLLLAAAPALPAPDGNASKETAPKEKEGSQPVFFLRDQSKIAGAPKFDSLDVETQYGKLSIPRDQLVRIRFSRRLAPELKARIDQLITDLGNEDFDKREAATAALREVGQPALDV
jgi:hypothetical protein